MLFRLKKEVDVLSRLGALYFGSRKKSSSSVACFLQILTTSFKKKKQNTTCEQICKWWGWSFP